MRRERASLQGIGKKETRWVDAYSIVVFVLTNLELAAKRSSRAAMAPGGVGPIRRARASRVYMR